MNVLHVIPGMAPSSGPTQALCQMVAAIVDRGHRATVVSIAGRLPRQVRIDVAGADHTELRYTRPFRHWGFSVELRDYLREIGQFDVLHLHSMWLYPTWAAAHAARRGRIPYIVRPAGSLEPWSLGQRSLRKRMYYSIMEHRVLENAAAVHVISDQEARHVRQWGVRAPTHVVANGVDVEGLSRAPARDVARRALGISADEPVLLFLGRIHRKKGLDFLGGVMASMVKKMPETRLLVVGPDDDPEYLRRVRGQFKELGIVPHVQFLGEKTGEERLICYSASDVFVLPSQSENFGNVVVEALAVGIPVLASSNTPWGSLEAAGVGDCLPLVEEAWVEGLLQFLDPRFRTPEFVDRCRRFVRAGYSLQTLGRRLERLYRNAIRASAPTKSTMDDSTK